MSHHLKEKNYINLFMIILVVIFSQPLEGVTPEKIEPTHSSDQPKAETLIEKQQKISEEVEKARQELQAAQNKGTATEVRNARFALRRNLMEQERIDQEIAQDPELTTAQQNEAQQHATTIAQERQSLEELLSNAAPDAWKVSSLTGPNSTRIIEKLTQDITTVAAQEAFAKIFTPEPVFEKKASLLQRLVDCVRNIFGLGKPSIIAAEAPSIQNKIEVYDQVLKKFSQGMEGAIDGLKKFAAQVQNNREIDVLRKQMRAGQEALKEVAFTTGNKQQWENLLVNSRYQDLYKSENPFSVLGISENTTETTLISKAYETRKKELALQDLNSPEIQRLNKAFLTLTDSAGRVAIRSRLDNIRKEVTSSSLNDLIQKRTDEFLNNMVQSLEASLTPLSEQLETLASQKNS